MKDCKDCQHREWSNTMRAYVCANVLIVKGYGFFPRDNIERADGFCGPEAKYFKDKRDI
jgi:hypothetical protein